MEKYKEDTVIRILCYIGALAASPLLFHHPATLPLFFISFGVCLLFYSAKDYVSPYFYMFSISIPIALTHPYWVVKMLFGCFTLSYAYSTWRDVLRYVEKRIEHKCSEFNRLGLIRPTAVLNHFRYYLSIAGFLTFLLTWTPYRYCKAVNVLVRKETKHIVNLEKLF